MTTGPCGVRVDELSLHVQDLVAAQPFRFGRHTLRDVSSCVARAVVRLTPAGTGREVESVGYAADLLAPKWFAKDPAKSPADDVADLLASAREAARLAVALEAAPTAFAFWSTLYATRVGSCALDAPDRLVRGFGVALVERAVLDAVCRGLGLAFRDALRDDAFGFRPATLDPRVADWRLDEAMTSSSRRQVDVRHTVGLADPLDAADASSGDSGGPTLERFVARDGLRWLKIKVGGDVDADASRLLRIAAIVARSGRPVGVTLDGNESFVDLDDVLALLDRVAGASMAGRELLAGLVVVEQPLDRRRTFEPEPNRAAAEITARYAPLLIDEADGGLDDFDRARAVGYRGVSAKSCKGIFRAWLNRARCDVLGAREGVPLLQTAEDLTTLPVLALQQDLAQVAALGVAHVERNGHHYFPGLDHVPNAERDAILADHADVYTADGLRIVDGRVALDSIVAAPGLGYAGPVDVAARRAVACETRTQ